MTILREQHVIDARKDLRPTRRPPMFDLQKLIAESHQKLIGHYRQLLATSKSDEERERIRRLIGTHEQFLQKHPGALRLPRRAA
jgi:hypothetical protein